MSQCKPAFCQGERCTEEELQANTGFEDPNRFEEDSVPAVLPIVHLLAGTSFHLPELPGFELRLDAGFYNAFYLSLGVGYLF